ncbi:hypothetical protein FJY84_02950 [Candidatus Bathyarchaeota archaeon]|nr:hypothetical protein [Candidatus Bathyarchaeota archaeon]
MSIKKKYFIILLLLIINLPKVNAYPSGNTTPPTFTFKQGFWYDSWGITRDSAEGAKGFIPFMSSETLGENKELAFAIGERFRNSYSNDIAIADAILAYVQRWTEYGYDEDNVYMNRVAQEEWAWNADEMAHAFNENKGITAIGDCEDVAFLCLTIYDAAGIETAIVDAPGHCALLIWMPNYPNANIYWELSEDSRGPGWIWIEATGDDNTVGWTPSDFHDGNWKAYTLENGIYNVQYPTEDYSEDDGWGILIDIIILILTIMAKIFLRF